VTVNKRLACLTFVGVLLSSAAEAQQSVTVYFEPTPMPKFRQNGSTVDDNGVILEQNLAAAHAFDGWFGSTFNTTIVRDNNVKIGGWGDYYVSPWRIDTVGLPTSASQAVLFLWALPSGAGPSQMAMFPISSDWNPTTVGWSTFPSTLGGALWPVSTLVNAYRGYDITTWYSGWKNGTIADKGLMFEPWNSDGTNRFDLFSSHREPNDAHRPVLGLVVNQPAGTPSFKLPLPGGVRWILNGESGGYECMGQTPLPDTAHQGNNYFALDFGPQGFFDNSNLAYAGNVPIVAAAGGTVVAVETNANNINTNGGQGWYITLDHSSGYYTRYLHFANRAARLNNAFLNVGDHVNQGDQIGIMGGTGKVPPYGTHVHMNFWYGGFQSGSSGIAQLTTVTMEGLLIKSYQTECSVNTNGVPTGRIRYYHSSNVSTGQ
jgi:Peptidase family M23